jgi:SAM-dependent methyltransferase
MVNGNYVFDDTWQAEGARIHSLEAALDPGTIRHLRDLSIGPGWRCLEVGAGAGSIAAWLCEQVGTGGHVVATDVQTAYLEAFDYPNLEVLRHDIAAEELPAGQFDLVHVRWTLHWPPTRTEAIRRMVSALRPGGWLLAEEPDFVPLFHASSPEHFRVVVIAAVRFVEKISGGMDSEYGRRLPADLTQAGLVEVQTEGLAHLIRGAAADSSGATWLRLSIEKVREALVESGSVTEPELDKAVALLGDPGFATLSPLTVAAWGRRPTR